MTTTPTIEALISLLVIYVLYRFLRSSTKNSPVDIRKEWHATPTPSQKPPPSGHKQKSTYTLKAEPRALVEMPEPTTRLFTFEEESRAAWARQRLWIHYKDKGGNVTERKVEIYQPEKDEVLYTWCCLKQEPRTFARRNILQWRLLPERFDYDPVVAQYWDEEGTLDQSEKLPWRRWLQQQPAHIASRYNI